MCARACVCAFVCMCLFHARARALLDPGKYLCSCACLLAIGASPATRPLAPPHAHALGRHFVKRIARHTRPRLVSAGSCDRRGQAAPITGTEAPLTRRDGQGPGWERRMNGAELAVEEKFGIDAGCWRRTRRTLQSRRSFCGPRSESTPVCARREWAVRASRPRLPEITKHAIR